MNWLPSYVAFFNISDFLHNSILKWKYIYRRQHVDNSINTNTLNIYILNTYWVQLYLKSYFSKTYIMFPTPITQNVTLVKQVVGTSCYKGDYIKFGQFWKYLIHLTDHFRCTNESVLLRYLQLKEWFCSSIFRTVGSRQLLNYFLVFLSLQGLKYVTVLLRLDNWDINVLHNTSI